MQQVIDNDKECDLTVADLSPKEYFPDIGINNILHGALPYRVKRSLADGIADLRAASKRECNEGAFVFDAQKETWYSLGGSTQIAGPGHIIHKFDIYDASRLSNAPVFVHVHPERMEHVVGPPRHATTAARRVRLAKFYAAVPSPGDFAVLATCVAQAHKPFPLRGLIVTSSGLTAFSAPADIPTVKAFAADFLKLRDETLCTTPEILGEPAQQFARRMVAALNEKLPDGFFVRTLPYENIAAPAARQDVATPAPQRPSGILAAMCSLFAFRSV